MSKLKLTVCEKGDDRLLDGFLLLLGFAADQRIGGFEVVGSRGLRSVRSFAVVQPTASENIVW